MTEIRGRTALLTGASGGIGPHIARALAREGADLALAGLPEDGPALEALRDELRVGDSRATALTVDLTEGQQRDALCDRVANEIGPVDLVVHNAGIELTAAHAEFTPEELERIVAVNLTAPLVLTGHALRAMRQRGSGHVVFIASLAGKVGTPYNVPYSATKAGLIGLTQSLRAEYAGTPVGFSVISPSFVSGGGMYARMQADGAKAPFVARALEPTQVADAVVTAIKGDLPEIIVSRVPMRPVLALATMAPRLGERFLRKVGPGDLFRHMAQARGRAGEPLQ